MDIDQLVTFLSVLEHGSFSRAAEALRVGQSTVSFHVKALETAVGTRLLDRGGGRVRPTATGALLRPRALRIVSLRDEALARLSAAESGEAGRLVIAASTIPAEHLLPPVLARFLETHGGIAVTVGVSDSRRAIAELLAHDCELALVGSRVRDKRIVFTPFAEDEVLLVGRPSRPARRRTETDVGRARLIVREEGSGTRQAVSTFLARHASPRARPPASLQVGSTESARRCALEGIGLALLSRLSVAEDLDAGRLVVVPAPGLPIRRSFCIARLRSATPSAAARALCDLLLQKNR
jgi:DNA-binding transcriptional LysR family regulator